ncbi:MAG: hypothetical protein H6550_14895 [Chitinophagales bacterium]|nr:hypothetical protein [Chitinophagales bacterium]
MFIGHFGIGLAAKKIAPKVSLGTLFVAAQFLDLLWPVLVLLGYEHFSIEPGITKMNPLHFTDYPISHSLLMACVWALAVGIVHFIIKRNKGAALVLALCVISHWILDLIVHIPDLPLYPGGPLVGMGLWNIPAATIIVELLIFFAGIASYLQITTAKNKSGKYGFWGLVLFLLLIQSGNIFGPPPANANSVAWGAMSQWILVLWAYWVDYNRIAKNETS